jgi:hypothetical protein
VPLTADRRDRQEFLSFHPGRVGIARFDTILRMTTAATEPRLPALVDLAGRPVDVRTTCRPLTRLKIGALVGLPLVGLLAGLAVGLVHTTQYRAYARLYVGAADNPTLSVGGYDLAQVALASTYSRVGTSPAFESQVATDAHLSLAEVRSSLVVTPEPQVPVIRIETVARNRATANALAAVAARDLSDRVAGTVLQNALPTLYRRGQAIAKARAKAQAEVAGLKARLALPATKSERRGIRARLTTASGRLTQANARWDLLRSQVSSVASGDGTGFRLSYPARVVADGNDGESYPEFTASTGLCLATLLSALLWLAWRGKCVQANPAVGGAA